jgi:Cu-Zn family superoxide dismutase
MKPTMFFKALSALMVVTLFSFFSCEKDKPKKHLAEAVISSTKSDVAVQGTLKFYKHKGEHVTMELDITVPSRANSSVAVHLHEHGMCGNAGGDAHGHWNPTGKAHGKWGSDNFHAGDIGNISLDANGKGTLEITTDLWTINTYDLNDIVGKAVIVHGGVDDYVSQPAGNSGPRIGCGVVTMVR